MLYFGILVPLPAECSESVPSCHCLICIYTYKKSSVSQLPITVFQIITVSGTVSPVYPGSDPALLLFPAFLILRPARGTAV